LINDLVAETAKLVLASERITHDAIIDGGEFFLADGA